jgi:hypothetical protein
MLHAASCYWPDVTQTDLEQVAERAARAGLRPGRDGVGYLGSLLFATADLALCLLGGRPGLPSYRAAAGSASPATGS